MAYHRKTNTLIRRQVPTTMGSVQEALGGFWDTLTGFVKGAVGTVTTQTAQQAAAAQAQADLNAAMAAQQGGVSTETLMIGGAAVAAAAFIFLRKRK